MPSTGEAGEPTTAPEPRRLGRPPRLDRDAALAAARDVIAHRGIDRTRYADVAEASGVPVTTLQHAFGSLQAMLLESVQRSTASEIAILRDLSRAEAGTPWQRLSEFIAGAVHPPDDPDSWLVWLEFWRLAGRIPEIGHEASVIYAQWWDYVEELITLGVASGDFTIAADTTPREAAIATVGIIDGVSTAIVVRADGPDHARALQIARKGIAGMLGYAGPPASRP